MFSIEGAIRQASRPATDDRQHGAARASPTTPFRRYTSAMHPARLLLHALLCFVLMANGIGAAMASVHGQCRHARGADADATAATQVAAEAHCAETMAMHAAETGSVKMHHDMPTDDPDRAEDTGGGCDGVCGCDCASHGFAALMPPTLALPTDRRIADVRSPADTHTAPSLPHPTRPPIV